MKEYNFQSVNQKKSLVLFISVFVLFLVLMFSMIFLKMLNIYIAMIFSIGIPFLIFRLNRKKVIVNCIAKIFEKSTEINIEDKLHVIDFEEIKNYKVEAYNGSIILRVRFKNNEKFNLIVSSSYGETKSFEDYCDDLETTIENFKRINNIEVERIPSFFEKSWVFPSLIVITLITSIFVVFIISKGNGFPPSLISALAPLLGFWGGYLNVRNKRKSQEK